MSNLIPIKLAEQAIASLEADIERLRGRYAEAINEISRIKSAGNQLSKQTMVVMLSGNAHEELIAAHDAWKDVVDGSPNWGKTQNRKQP